MPTTLVSWNLKGSADPDIAAVVDHLRAEGADVVALQEVQWHQARRLARALGARSHRWSFKHFPLRTWPEGMAIVGVTRAVRVRARALSFAGRVWSWRRRIVQVGSMDGDVTLANVHLSPHGAVGPREAEAGKVLALVAGGTGPVVVAGDLNERPGGPVGRQMAAAGMRDGWLDAAAAAEPGEETADAHPTNWSGWWPGTPALPTRQIDYVYVSAAVPRVALRLPDPGQDGLARYSVLSDHLPLTGVLDL